MLTAHGQRVDRWRGELGPHVPCITVAEIVDEEDDSVLRPRVRRPEG